MGGRLFGILFIERNVTHIEKEYMIKEIYNPDGKSIDEKLKEVFVTFLTEKIMKNNENH